MSKFDKKSPKGSVPNCQLQIANRYDNRWFKCKLKPPKKGGANLKISRAAQVINNFLDEMEWLDVWREQHRDRFQFTWKRKHPLVMSRLDYFLTPAYMMNSVESCNIISNIWSDHSMVECSLSLADEIRGRGTWKLNISYFSDKEYVEKINEILYYAEYRYENLNPGLKFEMIKNDVREFSMYYGQNEASKRKINKEMLLKKLNAMEKKLACINLSSARAVPIIKRINGKIDTIRAELEKITSYEIRGTMLRSKVRFYEEGEKNSRYFFGLEKARAKSKTMKRIQTEEGKIIVSPTEVRAEQRKFYSDLYKSDANIKFELCNLEVRKITDIEVERTESEITMEELTAALRQTSRRKTPGPDGIPADFYQFFFLKMKTVLLETFRYAFKVGKIHHFRKRWDNCTNSKTRGKTQFF